MRGRRPVQRQQSNFGVRESGEAHQGTRRRRHGEGVDVGVPSLRAGMVMTLEGEVELVMGIGSRYLVSDKVDGDLGEALAQVGRRKVDERAGRSEGICASERELASGSAVVQHVRGVAGTAAGSPYARSSALARSRVSALMTRFFSLAPWRWVRVNGRSGRRQEKCCSPCSRIPS